jgi:hypothetical protein
MEDQVNLFIIPMMAPFMPARKNTVQAHRG